MTQWLDIAWAEQGVAEIAGPDASPAIVGYFRDAGRADILSDETSWCMAFALACLARANVSTAAIPKAERLMARSGLKLGTAIDEPRHGCLAIFKRGKEPWQGHIGFVVGWTETHLAILGGNQGNKVSVQHFPRADLLGLRWPAAPASEAQVAAQGSRIAAAAQVQVRDGQKSGGMFGLENLIPTPPAKLPGMDAIASQAGALQGTVQKLEAFALFTWGKAPWIAGVLIAWWLLRMAWNALNISGWRAEDHNTGANVVRQDVSPATETAEVAE